MTSRILLTAILGAFLHLAAAICNFAYAAPSQPKIKVGVSSALLGGAASYGLDIQDAVRFADEKLGKGRFELIFENDNCTGKDAVSVAQKFTQIEKVDVAIGFACSSAALSAAPIFERAKIPVLITSASSPKIAHAGEFIFRTILSD
ncbi:MAG: hypothetical protein DCC75_12490, partial [Proteobacteria bacterium]